MSHWGGVLCSTGGLTYDVVCDTCERKIARSDWLGAAYETWRLHVEGCCEFHPRIQAKLTMNSARLCYFCVQQAIDLYHEAMDPPEEEWEEREE